MEQPEVRALVVEVLRGVAPDGDFDTLDPAVSLREQLDLDSLDFLAYVERLSQRTGAPIPEEDYPLADTLDGCAQLLRATDAAH
jgi:acyl carrier protein